MKQLFVIVFCLSIIIPSWGASIPLNFDSSSGNVVNIPPAVTINFPAGKLTVNSVAPLTSLAGALLTANNLSELTGTASTARTNLGLGSLSTITPGTGVATAAAANVNASGGFTTFGTDLPLAGGTMSGAIAMGANNITGIGAGNLSFSSRNSDFSSLLESLCSANTANGANVLEFQNLNATGYSAITFITAAGHDRFAVGTGNASSSLFPNTCYLESANATGIPEPFSINMDGNYGSGFVINQIMYINPTTGLTQFSSISGGTDIQTTNAIYDGGTFSARSAGSTTPPVLLYNTSSANFISGGQIIGQNLTATQSIVFGLGEGTATNNLGQIEFQYNGNGSTSNIIGFGFWGNDYVFKTDANGNTTAKGKAASVGIQDTTGSTHVNDTVSFDGSGNVVPHPFFASGTTSATVANTTTQTTLIPASPITNSSSQLKTTDMQAGASYRVHAEGAIADTLTPTLNILLTDAGADSLVSFTPTLVAITGTQGWTFDAVLSFDSVNNNRALIQGTFVYYSASGVPNFLKTANTGLTTIGTTSNQTLNLMVTWGAASASDTITCTHFSIEKIP